MEPGNYSAGLNQTSGNLNDPETRWGGIMRTLTTNDFEAANIEFIQFGLWILLMKILRIVQEVSFIST